MNAVSATGPCPEGLKQLAQRRPDRALVLAVQWFHRLPMRQQEIAACLGCSRGAISHIEKRALEKIRAAMRRTQ